MSMLLQLQCVHSCQPEELYTAGGYKSFFLLLDWEQRVLAISLAVEDGMTQYILISAQ